MFKTSLILIAATAFFTSQFALSFISGDSTVILADQSENNHLRTEVTKDENGEVVMSFKSYKAVTFKDPDTSRTREMVNLASGLLGAKTKTSDDNTGKDDPLKRALGIQVLVNHDVEPKPMTIKGVIEVLRDERKTKVAAIRIGRLIDYKFSVFLLASKLSELAEIEGEKTPGTGLDHDTFGDILEYMNNEDRSSYILNELELVFVRIGNKNKIALEFRGVEYAEDDDGNDVITPGRFTKSFNVHGSVFPALIKALEDNEDVLYATFK